MNSKEQAALEAFSGASHFPNPSRTFQIGEQVYLAGAKEAVITDILLGGKFLEIEFCTDVKQNNISIRNISGEPVAHTSGSPLPTYKFFEQGVARTDFFPWFQVFKLEPKAEDYFFDKQMKINAYITALRNLLNKVYFNGVDFEPDYQRGLVWDLDDKVKLIKSIQDGANIGLFVFATLRSDPNEGPCFEVTDGKQRLSTLKEYFEDGFQVDGLYFSELRAEDRDYFLDHTVEVVNLGQSAGKNRKFILKSFIILNRAGKRISEEHMEYVQKLYDEAEEYQSDKFVIKRSDI